MEPNSQRRSRDRTERKRDREQRDFREDYRER
jgi:hypothetical protein